MEQLESVVDYPLRRLTADELYRAGVPRPLIPAIPEFQATCQERLQRVVPPANTRPVRVFSQDESRLGLLTVRRRRLTAHGVQPIGAIQHTFEWFYVYGAVAPATGERFFLELPYLNADMFQLFVDAFAQAFPDSLNLLLLDNSGAHTAQRLRWPDNVRAVWLPPYCPELNPIERFWRDLKDDLGLAAVRGSRGAAALCGRLVAGL